MDRIVSFSIPVLQNVVKANGAFIWTPFVGTSSPSFVLEIHRVLLLLEVKYVCVSMWMIKIDEMCLEDVCSNKKNKSATFVFSLFSPNETLGPNRIVCASLCSIQVKTSIP